MTGNSKLVKQSSSIIVYFVISTLLSFFSTVIFTRYLAPGVFGNMTLTRTIINLIAIYSLFGLHHGLLRQGSIAIGQGRIRAYEQIRNYTISLSVLISIIVCTIVFVFANYIATDWFHNSSLTNFLRFNSFVIPIQLLSSITISLFQVNKKADVGQFIYLVVYFALTIVVFYVFTLFLKDESLAIFSFLAANIIYLAILIYYQRKYGFKFSLKLDKEERKSLFSISLPMFFASALNQSQKWTDTLFLGLLGTSSEVGIYYIGLRIGSFVSIPANAFNQSFTPIAGRLIGKGKHDELNELYKTVTHIIFICGSIAFAVIFFLKDYFVQIFGKGYQGSTSIVLIILISETVDFGVGASRQLITMSGGGKINLLNSIITILLSIGLSYWLIPRYGIVGAAIANGASNVLSQLITVFELSIIYKLSPFNKSYYALILIFTSLMISVSFLHTLDWLKLLIFCAVITPFYIKFGLKNKELVLVKDILFSKFKKGNK